MLDDGLIEVYNGVSCVFVLLISSLPELLEKKKRIDMHTNIATALLDEIKERKLDTFFEAEEKMITKSTMVIFSSACTCTCTVTVYMHWSCPQAYSCTCSLSLPLSLSCSLSLSLSLCLSLSLN